MNREFIKQNMVAAIMRKATAATPILRSEKIDQKSLDNLMRDYDRKDSSTLKIMAETGQDPNEMKEIFIEALESAFAQLKKRAFENTEIVFSEVSKRVAAYKNKK